MSEPIIDPANLGIIVDLLEGDMERVYEVLGDLDVQAFKPDELDAVQRDDLFYALGQLHGAGQVLDMTMLEVFDASWSEPTTTTEDKA